MIVIWYMNVKAEFQATEYYIISDLYMIFVVFDLYYFLIVQHFLK